MIKWQYLLCDLWFLKWKALGVNYSADVLWISVFSITSPSADFRRLQKTSDFFIRLSTSSGNLRKLSWRLPKSQHSQDKNLTLVSQKKLAGISFLINIIITPGLLFDFYTTYINNQLSSIAFGFPKQVKIEKLWNQTQTWRKKVVNNLVLGVSLLKFLPSRTRYEVEMAKE